VISPVTVTYTDVGEHVFTVPAGVTSIHVVAVGGKGGGGFALGGAGARTEGDLTVTPGQTLYAEVGGAGAFASQTAWKSAPGGVYGGGKRRPLRRRPIRRKPWLHPRLRRRRWWGVRRADLLNRHPPVRVLAAGDAFGGGRRRRSGLGQRRRRGGNPERAERGGHPQRRWSRRRGDHLAMGLWRLQPVPQRQRRRRRVRRQRHRRLQLWRRRRGAGGYSDAAYALAGGGGGGSSYGPAGTVYSNTSDPTSVTITYVPVPGPSRSGNDPAPGRT
jgi:hypothetical protein